MMTQIFCKSKQTALFLFFIYLFFSGTLYVQSEVYLFELLSLEAVQNRDHAFVPCLLSACYNKTSLQRQVTKPTVKIGSIPFTLQISDITGRRH